MKVLIIYDSLFGNTEQIARAIGNALDSKNEIGVFRVSNIKPEQVMGVDLLIVGSPTQGFRPTKATSLFLDSISVNGKVAAFDTRISLSDINSGVGRFFVKLGGYAAQPIADKLEKKGGVLIIPPEGFSVIGREGPLKEGELERAAEWARQIMKKL